MRDFLRGKRMKVDPECFPCFMKQCLIAIRQSGRNGDVNEGEVIKAALADILRANLDDSPAHATTRMHRTLRRMLGGDPFADVKSAYNRKALALYPAMKETVRRSADPLRTAARLAIAGNVIDFGIYSSIDIEGAVRRSLGEIAVDHYEAFRESVMEASEILYLLDNAGEVVFDRLLIEELAARGKQVTAVVKGSAVINDATMQEAREAGLAETCTVMDNGSDAVGTILSTTSEAFRNTYHGAGLVISKGQGNFETLLDTAAAPTTTTQGPQKRTFFLFQSKCAVVSRVLGLPEGSMLLAANH